MSGIILIPYVFALICWAYVRARGEGRIRNGQCWACGAAFTRAGDTPEFSPVKVPLLTKEVPVCQACRRQPPKMGIWVWALVGWTVFALVTGRLFAAVTG